MLQESLTIQSPFGICVFGSALLRISPDLATITATVTRTEAKPAQAFSKAKEGARAVTEFLRRTGEVEYSTSRISLSQEIRLSGGERKFLGYKARIVFTVVLKALDRMEELVSGLVDAGANEIASLEFQTSSLKDLRAQARGLAMEAAKEKAATYAKAANVSLGSILHIQDVNPQVLQRQWRSQFHVGGQGRIGGDIVDKEPEKQSLDPGAIEVGAAVMVAFGFKS